MSVASKYNKKSGPRYNYIFPAEVQYKNLKDLYDSENPEAIIPVYALFINNGQYGEQPICCTSGNIVINMPSHVLKDVKAMRDDSEVTEAINSDHLGFKIRTYKRNNDRRTFYTVEWIDM